MELDILERLKVLGYRKTVYAQKLVSDGAIIRDLIAGAALPREPSKERIAKYQDKYPSGRFPTAAENGKEKKLLNCCIDDDTANRMKTICYRMSVHRMLPMSEAALVSGLIIKAQMPPIPPEEKVKAYLAIYPKKREKIAELAKIKPKRFSTKRD